MSTRQLAMVMDLNKCIGCQTCTVACKTQWTNRNGREGMYWNNVETKPGMGFPKKWEELGGGFDEGGNLKEGVVPSRYGDYGVPWDYNGADIMKGAEFKAQTEPRVGPNWDEDVGAGEFPNSHFFYLPRICNHCSNPSCLAACPREAIFKRDQDGIVLVDLNRCEGNRMCIAACPYKKIYFNHATKVSQKCIFCFPRLEQGVAPACARQCPGRVRFVGYRDDENAPIWKLVEKWKVALPLHPEFGTEPNVFYVPPGAPASFDAEGRIDTGKPRIPNEYLVSLFGERVLDALQTLAEERAKAARGERSELMDLLIAYRWQDMFGGFDRDPQTIKWVEA